MGRNVCRIFWLLMMVLVLFFGSGLSANASDRENDFSIDSDKVITDRKTGLQWYVGSGNLNLHEAIKYCKELNVAGGGWRMPFLVELHSLFTGQNVSIGMLNFKPYIPRQFRKINNKIVRVWANDKYSNLARAYNYTLGAVDHGKYSTNSPDTIVFAVRSQENKSKKSFLKQSKTRYNELLRNSKTWRISSDKVITDKDRGLQWYMGPNNVTWKQAKEYCQKLDVAGGGWRMPDVKELAGLYTGEEYWERDHSLPVVFNGKKMDIRCVWSNKKREDSKAWIFTFAYGWESTQDSDYSSDSYIVFAVRELR